MEAAAAHQDHHDDPRRERVEVESERLGYLDTLATVRAFYLDLAEWGLEDPVQWGVWVAPCPISQEDLVRKSSSAVAKPAWTAAPANGCPCCRSWSKPSTGGAASRGNCWKPGNKHHPERSSSPSERP
ncbi:hypothetical protein [Mycobacterium riyadhense]|uniref:hypothetical protein n=1 Tax=Mycobacterium riyadhense TaxID=486698 RepID=UPI0019575586|nr:hypothetical protein [Mycobacterium riyadhense]